MIFLLFLASIATIELILRHDAAKSRKIKPHTLRSVSDVSPDDEAAVGPAAESVLALMSTLEQHGRGKPPVITAGSQTEQAEVAVQKTSSGSA